ncbi:polymorphic toxin type 43 domain-containing protein [Saccharothrix sp. S26]|uniref:RHS repeat-associated core domain-containing protein n=1 Tax=Saccharothrix sp. S26 TaxID=2907215 RepID=UPI001F1F2850|nr:RHS repeat-associated core domain-containing protein [Saccharothrix sp. S26]MCE6994367.1 polymorphic toxin type 43 domain-containing protein [Saccharothrix sp. S26]
MTAVAPTPAQAQAGPSVPLPDIPSVPVTSPSWGSTPVGESTSRALRGNQSASTAAPDGGGSFKATPLSPSATWDVARQTGDFTWSYPLRVPPSPGGFQPSLGLSYRSSAVDGRTSATNNQSSWVGEGWELGAGYVERTYGGCTDDTEGTAAPTNTGDLCWRSDNATATYPGGGGMLVRNEADGAWRQKSDNGARISLGTGVDNGDDNGEHWTITTVDGTTHYFGSRKESNSTWTVPVFGDDEHEQCNGTTFATSWCVQAWRWNLDKSVDARGNVILYDYETETNSYGLNAEDAAVSYVRAGTLKSVTYGLRDEVAVQASARVDFELADRCVPGSDCVLEKPENWPDTSLADRCAASTCPDLHSPTFWSTKRLNRIVTKVWRGTAFDDVDSWTLGHEFPDPGSGEKATLWLKSITHTGHVGATDVALPAVTFEGTRKANRVEQPNDAGPLLRFRLTAIVSEAGGITSIAYADPDCAAGSMPASAESNTKRCFPVTWTKKDFAERTDYFHKYVVASVTTSDRFGANAVQKVSYDYLDGAAWHFSQSEFTPADRKTWDEYRGYARVEVRTGLPTDTSGPITLAEERFYRGMGGTFTDSAGGTHTDHDWLQGVRYESTTYLGDTDEVVSRTIDTPSWQGPTATRGEYKAYFVHNGSSESYTALKAGGWRTTRTESTYDELGLVLTVNDLGDTTTAADDKCVTTTYARNTAKWLVNFPSRQEAVAVACGTPPTFPAHALADEVFAYDGQDFGVAPTKGDLTSKKSLRDRPQSAPGYGVDGSATYDKFGRPLTITDAAGNESKLAYTPADDGPLTKTVTTDALGHTTTLTVEPAWGTPTRTVDANLRVTEVAFDALGRNTEVWLPNRRKTTNPSGSAKYAYLVRNDAPSAVSETKVGPNGNYTTATTLYDGLYRVRQVQTPTHGGRLLAETRYDSHGRQYRTTQPYYNAAPVDTTLWTAADNAVPSVTWTRFDGASRPVKQVFYAGEQKKWEATTAYDGDRVHVTPPAGGTATTTVSDARGHTTQLLQYHGPTPAGTFDTTTYAYWPTGSLASATDPAGNTWRWTYDVRGHLTRSEDVDRGVTTTVYNARGLLETTTDARGRTTWNGYDKVGRRTEVREGGPTGTLLHKYSYDTAGGGKGRLASATRYVNGAAYTQRIDGYDSRYRPTSTSVVIPEAEGLLRNTYTSHYTYNQDGTIAGETFPAAGVVPAETVLHVYDDLGRPTTTNGGIDGSTTRIATQTSFTRLGELERIHLGDGGKRTWLSYYYEADTRRLNRYIVDAETPAPMQADVTYGFDDAGNVRSVQDATRDQPVDLQCFTYDHLRRLSDAWTPAGGVGCGPRPTATGLSGPAPYWQSFDYDKAGNRLTEVDHKASGNTTRTYKYPLPGTPQAHTVRSVTQEGPAGKRIEEFGYDPTGNTTTRTTPEGVQELGWDAEGKLVEASGGVTFIYGVDGTRLLRKDAVSTTLYLGNQEVELAVGAPTPAVTRYYTHAGRTVAMREGKTKLTWLGSDHQGTSQVSVDVGTMTATKRRQLPFGGARGPAVLFPGERGFVGGTNDEATGLVHIGARQYDTDLGRFLSVDPIMDVGNPQQWNGYAYADHTPVTLSDPTGLATWMCPDGDCGGGKKPANGRGYSRDPVPNGGGDVPAGAYYPPITDYGDGWYGGYDSETGGTTLNGVPTPWTAAEAAAILPKVAAHYGGPNIHPLGTEENVENTYGALLSYCVDSDDCSIDDYQEMQWPWIVFLGETGGLDAGGRGSTGKLARSIQKFVKMASCRNSFSGDTHVLMADGTTKAIEDVRVGDVVLNANPETGETEAHKVTAVHVTDADKQYVDLTVATPNGPRTITATAHHSFYEASLHRWTEADDLRARDVLDAGPDNRATVLSARPYVTTMRTHNLSVEGVHTFFVLAGETPVLVHNNGPECGLIRLDPGSDSADALKGFEPSAPEIEYVFEPGTGRFVTGDSSDLRLPGSPHEKLARSIAADEGSVLGGTIFRDGGRLVFTENSGHYGHRWNDAHRRQFQQFLDDFGVEYDYRPWG